MALRDRIKRFTRIEASKLRAHPHNWKNHPDSQRAAVRAALDEIGFADALLVRELRGGNYELIDGHLRAELNPDEKLPVLVLDVNKADAAKIVATLDPLAGLATANADRLDALMEVASLDSEALKAMLAEMAGRDESAGIVEDDVPAPPAKAQTKKGDLYQLGNHRLLCGDSAKAADVDRLINGAEVHLVNTDPPYNVRVEPRSNNAIAASRGKRQQHQDFDAARRPNAGRATHAALRPKDRPLENDFISPAEFERLLNAWFGNMARVLMPGGAFYIWGGYANCGNYPPVLQKVGLYFSQAIIWVKEHPVLTRKDFMGNHEWSFYGWREGAAHRFFGPNNVPDVWSVRKVTHHNMVHLTEKPVELAARAIGYSTKAGEHVLDLFGGSGSTLMAAEQLGRRALLMEIDPLYCDVIVARWERLTNRKARRHRK